MEFISRSDRQFRANLHAHTTLSDGCMTPEASVEAYRNRGYQILALTDHEAPYDHTDLSQKDFLLLTAYEAYIRPSAQCKLDRFGPEIHLNLYAREPHNLTYIGYDPNFCKYLPMDYAQSLPKGEDLGPRLYDPAYIQRFIDSAVSNGYLVSYNHPCWSMENPADVLNLNNCFSMEVFNTGSMMINGFEQNMALYDAMLRRGKFWYCHGADDNHNTVPLEDPLSDSFGAWTMIIAPELTYEAVMDALERGRFYATTGPRIDELTIEQGRAVLKCSEAIRVIAHFSPKYCKNVYHADGSTLTCAEFDIPEEVSYVYFTVIDRAGNRAHTHAFTRAEFDCG